MTRYISLLVVVFAVGASSAVANPPNEKLDTPATVNTLAQSALLGMQLSIKRGYQAGKVPGSVANCVAVLKTDSFAPMYEALLKSELTPAEQQATESFFKSSVGSKYAKHGLLQIYLAVGEKAPESLPSFSPAEMKELEGFSKTSAGEKLMIKKVMQTPAAAQAVNTTISQLLSQCDRGQ